MGMSLLRMDFVALATYDTNSPLATGICCLLVLLYPQKARFWLRVMQWNHRIECSFPYGSLSHCPLMAYDCCICRCFDPSSSACIIESSDKTAALCSPHFLHVDLP